MNEPKFQIDAITCGVVSLNQLELFHDDNEKKGQDIIYGYITGKQFNIY